MKCDRNDCGWCYAELGVETNSDWGQCSDPDRCPYAIEFTKELEEANKENTCQE